MALVTIIINIFLSYGFIKTFSFDFLSLGDMHSYVFYPEQNQTGFT